MSRTAVSASKISQQRQSRLGRGRRADLVAILLQNGLQTLADIGLIIDQQNSSRCYLHTCHLLLATRYRQRDAKLCPAGGLVNGR
jgi:hypothetical protein